MSRKVALVVLGILWVISTQAFGAILMAPLERRYRRPTAEELKASGVTRVVILSGGGEMGPDGTVSEPAVDAMSEWSRARFLAGIDLTRRIGPDCRVVFTGAIGRGFQQARELLWPELDSSAEWTSKETAYHPRAIGDQVGDRPFALVTSAFHMPRSMRVFRRGGLTPIAYPAGYLGRIRGRIGAFVPSAEGAILSQTAINEYAANLFDVIVRP